jgi:hypothetical protein
MGKAESFAKHKMRENRHNQFRPEQQQMCREIGREFPEYSVIMEETIPYTKENGDNTCAIVDICILELGVCYRLNGQIHNTNRAEEHDWEQKLYLEQLGFFIIDVDTQS